MTDLGDADKAHRQRADLCLRHPAGQQSAKVGCREHAVGEHVRNSGLAGKIDVDVDLVVVAGRAGIQRQRGAIDRTQLEQRQFAADLYVAVLRAAGS
ncbi:hypothetical protein D3C76_1588010 [compost metagenome]